MIEKIYENKFGVIHYVGLKKDLETIKTNEDYLFSKANGSKFYNIENLSDSLVWNEEDKQWIEYDARGINTDDYVLKEALDNYVLKEEGKGLSTEDFTTFYKEKLDNLEAISAQIVDELPETGDKNCYYFVPDNQSEGTNNDFYVTFMYFETLGWKTIGTTKIDLKDYVTFAYLYENNYNKVETDNKFQTKADTITSLALKANSVDVYTKEESDAKYQTLLQFKTEEEYNALSEEEKASGTYFITSEY